MIAGDGAARNDCEARMKKAVFLGAVDHERLSELYASADVFLFPSLSDTFGNVTLEALASGLPVVAYRVAAAAELVTDRVNGRLVEPGDEEAFAIAACLLVALHPEHGAMRACARAAACECDWDTVLLRFERQLIDAADAYRPAGTTAACVA